MLSLVVILLLCSHTLAVVPNVPLKNAANPGLTMPATGLGTGGYSNVKNGYDQYPECWAEPSGCGSYVYQAITTYLVNASGRRLDCADTYQNQRSIGQAMLDSRVPREEIFLLSKVGSGQAMGYNDTLQQFAGILSDMQTTYVDALLIHWPTSTAPSTDPACNQGAPTYNATDCRISTWRAMLKIFASGGARSVGVSNYEIEHLQEIAAAGLALPAINQCPFNVYHAAPQMPLVKFCQENNILFLAYSPLGAPDWHKFPQPLSPTPLLDPVVQQIAASHGKTPAQVITNWAWSLGVPNNPRSMNLTHMLENLSAYDFTLTADEIAALNSRPQDLCKTDPWYECASNSTLRR